MSVVYNDTDSAMVVGPSIRAFAKFVDWLNAKRFPAEVSRFGCKENHVKIAFEKSFSRIVFVSAKRYCGTPLHFKFSTTCNHCTTKKGSPGSVDVRTLACRDCGHVYDAIPRFLGKPEIKGLEYKRGDKGKLARELQGRVIDFLVGGVRVKNAAGKEVPINADRDVETPTDDVAVYRAEIERARNHVLAEPLPLEEVRWSKGISKSLREYGKDATEAHVRAAKMLVERGYHVARGMRVEYVVVDGSVSPQRVIPAEDYAGECDRFHLWEKVYAPTQHLLEKAFPDEDWASYADVRPKGRAAKDKALEGQLGMFVDHDHREASAPAALTRVNANADLAVATYSSKPLVVRVPGDAGKDAVERVVAVLRARAGSRRARIGIVTQAGTVSLTKAEYLVSAGPTLFAEVEAAIAEPPSAP